MRLTARLATGAVVLGVVAVGGAPAASAQAACPAGQVFSTYSETCVLSGNTVRGSGGAATGTGVLSGNTVRGTGGAATETGRTRGPATLPFTGGEVVLAAALGVAALGAGAALVVAGRRRSPSVA